MSLQATQGENIIKSWDYAKEKKLFGAREYNLTLTDRRLIASEKTSHGVTRNEYDVQSITGVETSCDKKRSYILSAIFILAGIVVLIISLTGGSIDMQMLLIGVVPILLGISIFFLSFKMKLSVYIYGIIGCTSVVSTGSSLRFRKVKVGKIKVDRQTGEEIASTLGSYLLVALR